MRQHILQYLKKIGIFVENDWIGLIKILKTQGDIKDYNQFCKYIMEIFVNDILINYSRPEIALLFNLILRHYNLLINYDYHLIKYNKYDYII